MTRVKFKIIPPVQPVFRLTGSVTIFSPVMVVFVVIINLKLIVSSIVTLSIPNDTEQLLSCSAN